VQGTVHTVQCTASRAQVVFTSMWMLPTQFGKVLYNVLALKKVHYN